MRKFKSATTVSYEREEGDEWRNRLTELSSTEIVSDLGQLERNRIGTVASSSELSSTVDDRLDNGVSILSSRSSVGDGNDKNRLLELTSTSGTEDERLENFLVEGGTERGESRELGVGDELFGLGWVANLQDTHRE